MGGALGFGPSICPPVDLAAHGAILADGNMVAAPVPDLVALTQGRFQARCQFCKRESAPIPSVSAAGAWAVLSTFGWVPYETVRGAMPVASCKVCGEKNKRIMASVARAKTGRKRK